MREITINGQTINQEIQSYDHNLGNFVRVVIGVGKVVVGKFEFDVPQQFQTTIIVDTPSRVNPMTGEVLREAVTDYTDLLAMGDGEVKVNNLWTIVDRINARP
jgi:hypothetical protein